MIRLLVGVGELGRVLPLRPKGPHPLREAAEELTPCSGPPLLEVCSWVVTGPSGHPVCGHTPSLWEGSVAKAQLPAVEPTCGLGSPQQLLQLTQKAVARYSLSQGHQTF